MKRSITAILPTMIIHFSAVAYRSAFGCDGHRIEAGDSQADGTVNRINQE